MTTRVDIEEIESTKSEKFLAVVLAAFLLIGSIWFYAEVDDWVGTRPYQYSAAEQAVLDAEREAQVAHERAMVALEREDRERALAKDALDIALAKGGPSAAEERAYDAELAEYNAAQRAADVAAAEAQRAQEASQEVYDRQAGQQRESKRPWVVAGLRLGFIVLWFVGALQLTSAMRRRRSRFLPLGFAAVATGVVTALVFATDYITDYIDPLDLGPVVLSIVGAAATVGAFVGLQRWLARRIPGRRVRNRECPFCGHPVRGAGPHCEGCGREVLAACAACGQPRRVGASYCAHCGAS